MEHGESVDLPKYTTRILWLNVFSGNCSLANAYVLVAISESGSFTSATDNWACLFLSTLARLRAKLRGTAFQPLMEGLTSLVMLGQIKSIGSGIKGA
jgi:hypothetical protein